MDLHELGRIDRVLIRLHGEEPLHHNGVFDKVSLGAGGIAMIGTGAACQVALSPWEHTADQIDQQADRVQTLENAKIILSEGQPDAAASEALQARINSYKASIGKLEQDLPPAYSHTLGNIATCGIGLLVAGITVTKLDRAMRSRTDAARVRLQATRQRT